MKLIDYPQRDILSVISDLFSIIGIPGIAAIAGLSYYKSFIKSRRQTSYLYFPGILHYYAVTEEYQGEIKELKISEAVKKQT